MADRETLPGTGPEGSEAQEQAPPALVEDGVAVHLRFREEGRSLADLVGEYLEALAEAGPGE